MQDIWPKHTGKEHSMIPGRLSLWARFQNILTTHGIGRHASKWKDWETGPVNKHLLWICTIDKKKKKSLEKMSPFLLFWLKTVQRKQVLVHSCPWAQLRVEQTPVKSRRKLATPPSMFLSREASPALSALGETLREGGSFALFLYLPVCTHSAEERRYWTFWSQEYTRGPEHLQPLSVLNTSFQAKGSWQRPGGRQAGRRLQHLLPEMPASGLKCNDQLATPWAARWTHTPWALWVALP